MAEFEFLEFDDIADIHTEQLKLHGGDDGMIDYNVVCSCIARAQFTAKYEEDADVADLAAAYLWAFASSQGFCDGNKRTALSSCFVFLQRNGYDLNATSKEVYDVTMAVATKQMDKEQVADWIRDRLQPQD